MSEWIKVLKIGSVIEQDKILVKRFTGSTDSSKVEPDYNN